MSLAAYMILAGKTLGKMIFFRLTSNTSAHEVRYPTEAQNRLGKPQELKSRFAGVIGLVSQFGFDAK